MNSSILKRLAAYIIDVFVSGALVTSVSFGAFIWLPKSVSDLIGYLSIFAFGFYMLFKDGISGQSIGKRILKIRVIQVENGHLCEMQQSLIRNISLYFLGPIDWVFIFRKNRKRLGDGFAKTAVVNIKNA